MKVRYWPPQTGLKSLVTHTGDISFYTIPGYAVFRDLEGRERIIHAGRLIEITSD